MPDSSPIVEARLYDRTAASVNCGRATKLALEHRAVETIKLLVTHGGRDDRRHVQRSLECLTQLFVRHQSLLRFSTAVGLAP
jgi:hypothetical protein